MRILPRSLLVVVLFGDASGSAVVKPVVKFVKQVVVPLAEVTVDYVAKAIEKGVETILPIPGLWHHDSPHYPGKETNVPLSRWMGHVAAVSPEKSRLVDLLVIPGTHNSGTYQFGRAIKPFLWDLANTQSLGFTQQMEAGVRMLDLRLSNDSGDDPVISHTYRTAATLRSCLSEVKAFLDGNPKEFLLVFLRKDSNTSPFRSEEKALDGTVLSQNVVKVLNEMSASGLRFNGTATHSHTKLEALQGQVAVVADMDLPGLIPPTWPVSVLKVASPYSRDVWQTNDMAAAEIVIREFAESDRSAEPPQDRMRSLWVDANFSHGASKTDLRPLLECPKKKSPELTAYAIEHVLTDKVYVQQQAVGIFAVDFFSAELGSHLLAWLPPKNTGLRGS